MPDGTKLESYVALVAGVSRYIALTDFFRMPFTSSSLTMASTPFLTSELMGYCPENGGALTLSLTVSI